MKRVISLLLSLVIAASMLSGLDFMSFAEDNIERDTSSKEIKVSDKKLYYEFIRDNYSDFNYDEALSDDNNNTEGEFSYLIEDFDGDNKDELVLFYIVRNGAVQPYVVLKLFSVKNHEVVLNDETEEFFADFAGNGVNNFCGIKDGKNIVLQYEMWGFGGSVHSEEYTKIQISDNSFNKINDYFLYEFPRNNRYEYSEKISKRQFENEEEFDAAVENSGYSLKGHDHVGYVYSSFDPNTDDWKTADEFRGNHIFTIVNSIGDFIKEGYYGDEYYGFVHDNTGLNEVINYYPQYLQYQSEIYADNEGNGYGFAKGFMKEESESASYARTYYKLLSDDETFMNSVRSWEALHIVSEPSYSIEQRCVQKHDIYEMILFDLLNPSEKNGVIYHSDDDENKFYDVLKNDYNSFVISTTDKILGKDPRYTKENLSTVKLKDEDKKLLLEGTEFADISKSLSDFDTLIDTAKSVADAITKAGDYLALQEWHEGTSEILQYIANDSENDSELRTAAKTMANCLNDAFLKTNTAIIEGTLSGLEKVTEKIADKAFDALLLYIPGGAMIEAALIGIKCGRALCNYLFDSDKSVEAFYTIGASVKIEDATIRAIDEYSEKLNDDSLENATIYMRGISLYKNTVLLGFDYSIDLLELTGNNNFNKLTDKLFGNYSKCMELIKTISSLKENKYNNFAKYESVVFESYINRYCGNYDEISSSYRKISDLKKRIEAKTSQNIVDFVYDDFDSDGQYEAFAVTSNESQTSYEGTEVDLWYVNKRETKKINPDFLAASNNDKTMSFIRVLKNNGQKFVVVNKYSNSGFLSYIWYVKNGNCILDENGSGHIVELKVNEKRGWLEGGHSCFDAAVDGTGHTCKTYYFYFNDGLKEYGGIKISEDDLANIGASGILKKIKKSAKIKSIYLRGNGIININYLTNNYSNDNLTLYYNKKKTEIEVSNQGGIYEAAMISKIAEYPVKNSIIPKSKIGISKAKVYGIKNKIYSGKPQAQKITLKIGSKTLKKDKDYTINYKNNKGIGTAKIIVNGKGEYFGSITKTFYILPKATNINLTTGKKSFTSKWKKVSAVSGYQIQYSLKSNMKKSKYKNIKNANKTKLTVKSLKRKKKYYVRIRSYKKIGKKTYYSNWSSIKAVKTK